MSTTYVVSITPYLNFISFHSLSCSFCFTSSMLSFDTKLKKIGMRLSYSSLGFFLVSWVPALTNVLLLVFISLIIVRMLGSMLLDLNRFVCKSTLSSTFAKSTKHMQVIFHYLADNEYRVDRWSVSSEALLFFKYFCSFYICWCIFCFRAALNKIFLWWFLGSAFFFFNIEIMLSL